MRGGSFLCAAPPDVHAQQNRTVEPTSTDTVRVATPTGERVADRENVQAAFDTVQPGGTIVFAAGSYVVGGEGLVLRTPGVALTGDRDGTTLLGCTRQQRIGLSAREFSEVCGDGFVLAAEAQRVSGLRFESFWLALSIREATEIETQGRSASFTGGHVVENSSFHDGFSFQIVLDADSTVQVRRSVFRNVWHAVAISDVRVENNRITGAVGVAIEAAHVTNSRIVDNEIEVRPATTPEEQEGVTVGGNGGPGIWVLLGLVDEVNGMPVWVSAGSEGTVVRPPPRRRESDGGGD